MSMDKGASFKTGGRFPSSSEVSSAMQRAFAIVSERHAKAAADALNQQFSSRVEGAKGPLYAVESRPDGVVMHLTQPELASAIKGVELGTPEKPALGFIARRQALEASRAEALKREIIKEARKILFGQKG